MGAEIQVVVMPRQMPMGWLFWLQDAMVRSVGEGFVQQGDECWVNEVGFAVLFADGARSASTAIVSTLLVVVCIGLQGWHSHTHINVHPAA